MHAQRTNKYVVYLSALVAKATRVEWFNTTPLYAVKQDVAVIIYTVEL